MSELVRGNINFLRLLASTTAVQYRALVRSLTDGQRDTIREVAQNFEAIPTPRSNFTRTHLLLLRALGAKRISRKRLQQLLLANRVQYLHILRSISDYLSQL